jgi:ABC-type nitrate/sulfonate/bicarbonate transport system permease component
MGALGTPSRTPSSTRTPAGSCLQGLGWFIFEQKNQLLIADAFAGLLTVILFGLLVENLIFKTIESRTVRRWGMQV